MKKLLFVALAAVGMTACVQNEELAVAKPDAKIEFANAYVSNTSRTENPVITTANLAGFDVWAFMDETTGNVLTDEDVVRNGDAWGYSNIQYWFPNHTYYFAALAPMNSANITEKVLATGEEAKLGLGQISFTNVDGTEDLLYAKAKVGTPDIATLTNEGMDPVKMQFQHLLSKVRFTFTNGFPAGDVTVKVSDVTMIAPKTGTINLAQTAYNDKWALGSETLTLAFGNVADLAITESGRAANERFSIPATEDYEYNVTFHVVVEQGDVVAYELDKEAVIKGHALEMGKAYNFTAVIDNNSLNLHKIEFTAAVDEWVDANNTEIEIPVDCYYDEATNTYSVATAQGLLKVAEVVNGGKQVNVVLMDDIDLSSLTRAAVEWTPIGTSEHPFKGIFDGNGKTVSNFQVTALEGHAGLLGYCVGTKIKNLTVENVTLVANHYAGAILGRGYAKLDNCHADNVDITLSTKDSDWGDKAGGLVGQLLEGAMYIKNSTASNVNIKGYRDLGGIVGMAHYDNTVAGCSVNNITLVQDLSDDYQDTTPTTLGGVVGRVGNNVTLEGNTEENANVSKAIASQEAFESALKLGGNLVLAEGEYNFPAGNVYAGAVNVTAEAGKNVVVNLNQSTYIAGAALTLEGLTFKVPAGLTYNESKFAFIHHAAEFNMNNCVIEGGRLRLNVNEANIDNCQFNVTASSGFDGYGLYYYGKNGSTVNVSNSTFTALQKAIVLYNEGAVTMNLNVDNCTFTASQTTDKAAISIHSECGINGTVNINKSTATGFADYHGGLWRDVNNNTGKDNNKFTVTVDGVIDGVAGTFVSEGLYKDAKGAYLVTNAEGLATINAKLANKSAGRNVVVNLLADIDFTGKTWTTVDSHVDLGCTLKEFNGNGYTISNLTINGQAMFRRFANTADVTIKNLTFDNAKVNHNSINAAIIVGHTYDNLILDNVDVKNSTIVGGYKVSTLVATVYNESSSSITATLKNCDVINTTVKAISYDFCTTGMVAFVYADDNDKVVFENCTVSDVKLYAPNVYTAHAAIYTTGSETLFNEAEGVTVTNVTFENI